MLGKITGIIGTLFAGKLIFSIIGVLSFFTIFGAILNRVDCSANSNFSIICKNKDIIKMMMNKANQMAKYFGAQILKLLGVNIKVPEPDKPDKVNNNYYNKEIYGNYNNKFYV